MIQKSSDLENLLEILHQQIREQVQEHATIIDGWEDAPETEQPDLPQEIQCLKRQIHFLRMDLLHFRGLVISLNKNLTNLNREESNVIKFPQH